MKKKIESELVKIAHRILNLQGKQDLDALHREARLAYENLTLLKFMEMYLGKSAQEEIRSEIADKFESLAGNVLSGNANVPETNPHANEDDLMIPGMDTIKDMVKEMPQDQTLEELLAGFGVEPDFVKSDKTNVTSALETAAKTVSPPASAATPKASLNIGLNDKISFIKNLFEDNDEDYTRVISQLNTFDNLEEAKSFLQHMVKPEYHNWDGAEIYEARLMKILEARFS